MHTVANFHEQGQLPIYHLKRFWSKALSQREGSPNHWIKETKLDSALLDSLGLGLEPTMIYLYQQAPSFPEFETWIKTQTDIDQRTALIKRFNQLFEETPSETVPADFDFLSNEELEFFDREGYIIIRQAIRKRDCDETVKVITDHLEIDLQKPDTWYTPHSSRQGIMVQLFRHEVLERNRHLAKIRKAYECL
jgi:hypothetical protein